MASKQHVLIVDDESSARQLLAGYLSHHEFIVDEAADGMAALEKYKHTMYPVALVDMKMPGMGGLELLGKLRQLNPFVQVIVLTAFGSVETAVDSMRAGAFHYLSKPVQDLEELTMWLQRAQNQYQLVSEHENFRQSIADHEVGADLVGESAGMRKVKEIILLAAPTESTVLVTGESGTGKELVAKAIHAASPRSSKSLVTINCAAFPETLIEAELFGYERGAFTGADRQKLGRFELANGGTLFLDEIGELTLPVQVKLLRVLEQHTFTRLGGENELSLDIRIVAATNRDLAALVAEKKFREDLFFRLNVIPIVIPPLRDRTADLLFIANHLLARHKSLFGKTKPVITLDAARLLKEYAWPGNVRELDNVLQRALIFAHGGAITPEHLSGLNASTDNSPRQQTIRPLDEVEKEHIRFCLEQLEWNLSETADRLGIHRNTLRTKIKEFGLEEPPA